MNDVELARSMLDMLPGLRESEVEALMRAAGLLVRVVSRDGKPCIIEADHRQERVSLTVVDGRITGATMG